MSWCKVPAAAKHFGMSVKTFRKMLGEGFPHTVLPSGRPLINIEDGDKYLRSLGAKKGAETDSILKEVLL